MKLVKFLTMILCGGIMINGQDMKTLIADGTTAEPIKYSLQPKVEKLSSKELEAVKNAVLEKEVEFSPDYKQMSAEESNYKRDFEILDVAEGFFISREFEHRAFLYTAYSEKMKRNYQGVLVVSISNNGTKFTPEAHYVYEYRGDKHIRQLPDINSNFLSELAVFATPPTKKEYRRFVRIIEFSPNGLDKLGSKKIHSSIPQKQRMPYSLDPNKPAKMVYIPPVVEAVKLYTIKKINKKNEFLIEEWREYKDNWQMTEGLQLLTDGLDEDKTDYVELIKPSFPKGPGEK